MTISRKGFLQGAGCAAAGAALGALVGRRLSPEPPPPTAPPPRPMVAPPRGEDTFAQAGEDRIVLFILEGFGVPKIDYLDVGAYDPIKINNTYLFYRKGHRGVLVEPNGAMCERIREARPGDGVLEAGIGVTAAREADFYVMTDPSWSTFSKEEAELQAKASNGTISIKEVVKVPLLDINRVMDEHFRGAPAFLSVDTQGLDLAILKSIDYGRFRPKAICAETLATGTRRVIPEIAAFMESQGYVARGMSFVNTIFLDSEIL